MAEKFQIVVEPESNLIRLRVWGFWSLDEAREYSDELTSAMEVLAHGDPWNVLADVRMFPIQPLPVQKIHSSLMRTAMEMGMARAANVVGGRLTRIQVEELSALAWPEKSRFGYFSNTEEAESWLERNIDECPFSVERKVP